MSLNDFSWLNEEFDALTLTFVHHEGDSREVLRAGGHTWTEKGRGSMRTALDVVDGYDFEREPVLIAPSGPWVVLLAPNGYEYSYPGVLSGASRLGPAMSLFWNVEAVMRILVGQGGNILRDFDPLYGTDGEGMPLPEERGLPFGRPGNLLRPASLLLAERVTGQPISRDWLLQERELVILNRRHWSDDDPACKEVTPYEYH